jgi:hypothetical protein
MADNGDACVAANHAAHLLDGNACRSTNPVAVKLKPCFEITAAKVGRGQRFCRADMQ